MVLAHLPGRLTLSPMRESIKAPVKARIKFMPKPPILTVEEFDHRASYGDNMSEYFTSYAPCDMEAADLLDDIWAGQMALERASGSFVPVDLASL